MARYRHYENRGKAGDFTFVTTTCLDFAHLLRRPEMKCLVAKTLIQLHRRYKAQLHSYVVMSNPFHIVSRMPDGHDSPWFMQRVKDKTAKAVLASVVPGELKLLDLQTGLNRRTCWQPCFDSMVLVTSHAFHQKVHYTHMNRVRAGLATAAEEYPWSSAAAYKRGLWTPENGLSLEELL